MGTGRWADARYGLDPPSGSRHWFFAAEETYLYSLEAPRPRPSGADGDRIAAVSREGGAAAGFIGARVRKLLLAEGRPVVGIDDFDKAYDHRLTIGRLARLRSHPGFVVRRCHVTDRAATDELVAGAGPFDAVVHLAARAGVRHSMFAPRAHVTTNVTGILNVLEACRRTGVAKFVFSSRSSVYGSEGAVPYREADDTDGAQSPYAASRTAAELLARSCHDLDGLDVTVLRYFDVYGPAGRTDMSVFHSVQRIDRGEPVVIFGDGRQARDLTYVDDIARGTVAAIRPVGFDMVDLGSDRPVVLLDLLGCGRRAVIERREPHPADSRETLDRHPKSPLGPGSETQDRVTRRGRPVPCLVRGRAALGRCAQGTAVTLYRTTESVMARGRCERSSKRVLDVLLSVVGLVALLPVFAALALAVRRSGPGPVLLRQPRVGTRGSVFSMVKFRTMVADAEAQGRPVWAAPDDERVTAVGRVLRSSHLDELPQLWNVLVGDMSLVGPRPERPEISDVLGSRIPLWHRRHEVKPGITGWAQIRQGYAASVEESEAKLSYDLYYLHNRSLRFDLAILAATLRVFVAATLAGVMGRLSVAPRAADARSRDDDDGVTTQVAVLGGARLAAACLGAVSALVLALSLPKAEYGRLALLTGLVGFLVVLADAGLTSSLARYFSEQRVDRRLFVRVIALRGTLAGLAALGILAYGAAGGAPGFGSTTLLASVLLLANSAVSLAHGLLPTLRLLGVGAFLTVFQPAVELSAILVVAYVGLSAPAALGALTVAAGASAIIGLAVLAAHPVPAPVREPVALPELVKYAVPLIAVSACVSVFGVVDHVLIALLHDAETLAPYALSWKLVICLHLPAVAVAAVVAPRLIQDRERAPELLKRWMWRMAVAYAGVWAVVAALAPEIFGMIGGQYRSDAPVLWALTGYALLLSLGPLVSVACNFLGGARARLPVAAAAVAVNIVLDLALIPTWGLYGAALSSTLAYLIYVLGHARIAAGLLGVEPWSGGIRRAVRIAAGITTAVCVARLAVDALSSPGPLGTGIAGCAALAAYLAVVVSGDWR